MSVATIGDTVRLCCNHNIGMIKFIGPIQDKIGIYFGIELGQPCGQNNGSFNNKSYFCTQNDHGIFVKRNKFEILTRNVNILRITVGDIVTIKRFKCNGIIKFIGNTLFKPGIIWYGVQLEQEKGKNNGTVNGIKYFQCQHKYGIFVQSNKIQKTTKKKKKEKNINKKKQKKISNDSNDNYPIITRYFDRIKLLISGYNPMYDIPNEIQQIIFKYYFMNRYSIIEISKHEKKLKSNSWIKNEIKLSFLNESQFEFDNNRCPHRQCKANKPLKFIANYKRDENKVFHSEYNTFLFVNEYHCTECDCYIRHNILQHFYKNGLIDYPIPSTPIINHKYVFLGENGDCYECENDILLMERYCIEWRIRYCIECNVIHRVQNPDIEDSPYSELNNWGLPNGWRVCKSSCDGTLYFVNKQRKIYWDDPRPLPIGFEICEVPNNYTARQSHDGRVYFINNETGKSQWDDPRSLPNGFMPYKGDRGRIYYTINEYGKKIQCKDPRPKINI